MIEIELFCKTVEAAIREGHASYLRAQKRIPLTPLLPPLDTLPDAKEMAKLNFFVRWRLKRRYKKQFKARQYAERHPHVSVEDKLLKGYNAGVEAALSILEREYKVFMKRLERAEKADSGYMP